MRKIESDLVDAIVNGRKFSGGNTAFDGVRAVTLHGNEIALIAPDRQSAEFCLAGWNTPTTRSRINAIAVGLFRRGVIASKAGKPVHVASGRQVGAREWFSA